MHLRTIFAIARKDALDMLLNRSTLIVLFSPIFFAVLFTVLGNVLSSQTNKLLIYNPGNSQIERVLTGAFSKVEIVRAESAQDVQAAFGANGAHKSISYAAGLSVPADFDAQLRAGSRPQLALYINGDQVGGQQGVLLQQALTDYARAVVNPQAPIQVQTALLNPPSGHPLDLSKGFFIMYVLLSSLLVGTSVVPGLITEEKEKKTLRMLMVSPASFADVIMGKLLVGLAYQLLLLVVVMLIMQGFIGQVPLLLLFVFLGSCFSIAVGLLAGGLFQTASAAGGFTGFASFLYVIPALFVGPLGDLLQNNPLVQAMKVFPTYYLAQGIFNALTSQTSAPTLLLNLGVTLGSVLILLAISIWLLRRQATVVSSI